MLPKFFNNSVFQSATWALFMLAVFVKTGAAQTHVVINEIMYAPLSPEPEWIELFNPDTIDVNITKWKISNHLKSDSLPSASILANGYVVITKDSTALRTKRPGSYTIVQCNLPPLVNTGDNISLKDSTIQLIDSFSYLPSWGGSKGQSLERKQLQGSSTDQNNWGTSIDPSGATPGSLNSLSVVTSEHDVALVNLIQNDDSVRFTFINLGNNTVRQVSISLNIGDFDTVILPFSCNLLPQDSIQVFLALPNNFYGHFPAIANIEDSSDHNHSNDSLQFSISIPIPSDSLVINEIMFNPKVSSCQWIEVLNLSSRLISMDSTRLLAGESKPNSYSSIIPALLIPADSFGVISANDSIFKTWPYLTGNATVVSLDKSSLNFGKDSNSVVLHNYDSTTIDSVHYLKSWQHSLIIKNFAGISLERKDARKDGNDASNWQACFDTSGGTPLLKNSTSTSTLPDTIPASQTFQARFDPNPFSPDGDGFQDGNTLTVQTGDATTWALRVRIFDMRGNAVRTLTDATTVQSAITLSFDGKRDNGQTLSPGLYAALIELTSQSPIRSLKKTIGVAIAGKRR